MKKLITILSFGALFLLSSTSPFRKKLIGVWKIQSMEIKGVTMLHQQMASPYMEFNDEGGFMIKVGASGEKGRYTLKGNTVTLKFLLPKKPAQKLTITKLDDTEMDYTTADSAGVAHVICYRITTGLHGEKD